MSDGLLHKQATNLSDRMLGAVLLRHLVRNLPEIIVGLPDRHGARRANIALLQEARALHGLVLFNLEIDTGFLQHMGNTERSNAVYRPIRLGPNFVWQGFPDIENSVSGEINRSQLEAELNFLEGRGASPAMSTIIEGLSTDLELANCCAGPQRFMSTSGSVAHGLEDLVPRHFKEDRVWDYWNRWRAGILSGKPLDWELQRRVALIKNEEWEKGPERIAKIISGFELEARIEELEAERDRLQTEVSRHGIGGNDPPEQIEDAEGIANEVTIIWATIDDLKTEIINEEPNRAVVTELIAILAKGLKAVLRLCGRLSEHALKVVVTSAFSAGTATLIAKPELLEAIIEAARAWLPFL